MSALSLGTSATVREAPALHTLLRDALEQSPHLTIECSSIEGCDTAALQLLLAARAEARRRGGELRLAGVPESFAWCFQFAGLTPAADPGVSRSNGA